MKSNQIKDSKISTIDDISKFHEAMMPIGRRNIMKKNKWIFMFDNEWDIYSKTEFAVTILSINWQKDFKCIVIFGFAFKWEK